MLEAPDLCHDLIVSRLRDAYGLAVTKATFIPLGFDLNTAVYRVSGEGGAWFLKLRRGPFDKASVALPRLLADRGLEHIIAPLRTVTGELSARLEAGTPEPAAETFNLILYPFVEGRNGFAVDLDERQWVALGAFLRRLHEAALPMRMLEAIPREGWSPQGRRSVSEVLARFAGRVGPDRVANDLSALLESRRGEIDLIVERADGLAADLQRRSLPRVLCHTDIHAGNVLITAGGDLYVVDWDEPLLAPGERDLMFAGGGVGGVWNKPHEEAWFYQGYGQVKVDPTALAYYRYERIVQDVAVTCRHVFARERGDDDRRRGLRQLEAQFLPGNVVEIAHRTYERL